MFALRLDFGSVLIRIQGNAVNCMDYKAVMEIVLPSQKPSFRYCTAVIPRIPTAPTTIVLMFFQPPPLPLRFIFTMVDKLMTLALVSFVRSA
jgi:hypothetical protein